MINFNSEEFDFISEEEMDDLKFEHCENKLVVQLLQRIETLQYRIMELEDKSSK